VIGKCNFLFPNKRAVSAILLIEIIIPPAYVQVFPGVFMQKVNSCKSFYMAQSMVFAHNYEIVFFISFAIITKNTCLHNVNSNKIILKKQKYLTKKIYLLIR